MNVLVVGSAIVDLIARPLSTVRADASNEAEIAWAEGGAGRNIAENLARLGASVTFVTDAADDAPGRFLLEGLRHLGIDVRLSRRDRTGLYLAILHADGTLDRGYCHTGTEHIGVDEVLAVMPDVGAFDGAIIDANLQSDVVCALADRCRAAGVPYALETAAHERSLRVARAIPSCAFIKPDRAEATALTNLPCETADQALACADDLLAMGAARALVSLGADGLAFAGDGMRTILPALPTTVTDVTGAGDAMLAAVFMGILADTPPSRYLEAGRRAAALTCASRGAVSPKIGPHVFDE